MTPDGHASKIFRFGGLWKRQKNSTKKNAENKIRISEHIRNPKMQPAGYTAAKTGLESFMPLNSTLLPFSKSASRYEIRCSGIPI